MIDDTKFEESDLEERNGNAINFNHQINTRRSLLCIITAFQLLSGQGKFYFIFKKIHLSDTDLHNFF